jgi:DNA repair protein RecO (recombination protein O)
VPARAKSEAFLLRSVKYGEADRVVTLYTRSLGKVSCLAKNARASARRFGSALQPFCKFEALFRPRAGGLSFLEGATALKSWPGLIEDLDRLAAGYRLLEMADALEENGAVHSEFFDALESGLAAVAATPEPEEAVLRCEARLLQLAGWAPRLDACVACRREAPFNGARLSLAEGGLLCPDCKGEGSCLDLVAGSGGALQRLFEGREGSVAEARLPLRRFVEYQLGKALKAEAFERSMREPR